MIKNLNNFSPPAVAVSEPSSLQKLMFQREEKFISGKSDTHPIMESILIEGYRKMSPAQKFKMAMEMSEAVRTLAKTGILKRHPGISDEELRKRLGALLLGRELSIKVNGWDPESEGY